MTWEVGGPALLVAGVEGTITALDDDTVTINGTTLPRRIDVEGGVRYLSMDWPRDAEDCDLPHCDGSCTSLDDGEETATERITALEKMVRDVHDDDSHPGPFAFCTAVVCQWANR